MTAQAVLDRFEANLRANPDLAPMVGMIAPYRVFLGPADTVVLTLDALVMAYAEARDLNVTRREQ